MSCRIVGVLLMEDEAGGDEKLHRRAVVEADQALRQASRTTPTCPRSRSQQIEHFFAHYKDLEPGKWVKVIGWRDADNARDIVLRSIERAKAKKA